MFKKVLIAIDDSAMKDKVLRSTQNIFSSHELDITLLYVTRPESTSSELITADEEGVEVEILGKKEVIDEQRELEHSLLEEAKNELRGAIKKGRIDTLFLSGHPAHLICETAKDGAYDLIVIGHRGKSRFLHLVPGSTAYYVIRHASCSVLLVK